MKPAAWILLLFVLSGGISALLGNELGRKIGKKKLSLFSLRPKHTSTFMTVVLSMALSAGLFSLFLLLSPHDRQVLLNPDELVISQMEAQEQKLAQINQTFKHWNKRTPSGSFGQNAQKSHNSAVLPVAQTLSPTAAPTLPEAVESAPEQVQIASNPVQRRRAWSTHNEQAEDDWDLDLKEESPALPLSPKRMQQEAEQNAVTFQKRPSTGRSERAQSAQTQPSQRQQLVLARAHETLLRFETAPSKSPRQAEATVAKILELTEAYAQQMGLPLSEGSRVQVLVTEVQALKQSLLSENDLEIDVETAYNVSSSQPLMVHLRSTPQAAVTTEWDPSELLEQERLQPEKVKQTLQKDVLPAIRSALALKTPFYAESTTQTSQPTSEQPFVSAARLGLSGSQNVKIMDTLLDAESLKIRLWMLP